MTDDFDNDGVKTLMQAIYDYIYGTEEENSAKSEDKE